MANPICFKLLRIQQSLAKSRGLIPITETQKYIAIFLINSSKKIALVISPQPMAVVPLPCLARIQPQPELCACHGLFGKSAPEL